MVCHLFNQELSMQSLHNCFWISFCHLKQGQCLPQSSTVLHAAFIAHYDELQYVHNGCHQYLAAAVAAAETTTQLPAEPVGGRNLHLLAAAAEESVPLLSTSELRMAAAIAIDIGVCPVSSCTMNDDGSRCSINFGDMDMLLLDQILHRGQVSTAI